MAHADRKPWTPNITSHTRRLAPPRSQKSPKRVVNACRGAAESVTAAADGAWAGGSVVTVMDTRLAPKSRGESSLPASGNRGSAARREGRETPRQAVSASGRSCESCLGSHAQGGPSYPYRGRPGGPYSLQHFRVDRPRGSAWVRRPGYYPARPAAGDRPLRRLRGVARHRARSRHRTLHSGAARAAAQLQPGGRGRELPRGSRRTAQEGEGGRHRAAPVLPGGER